MTFKKRKLSNIFESYFFKMGFHVFAVFISKAETRAEFSERTVTKLEKTIDDLEGTFILAVLVSISYHPSFLHIPALLPDLNVSFTFT